MQLQDTSWLDYVYNAISPAAFENSLEEQAGCPALAADQTTQIDQFANDLSINWNPSGYYTPEDVNTITGYVLTLTSQAYNALNAGLSSAPASQINAGPLLQDAQTRLNNVASQTTNYISAFKTAQASNQVVAAPGLKNWVIEALEATSQCLRISYLVQCEVPSWVGLSNAVSDAATAVYNAAKTIVGIVGQIAAGIVHAAEAAFDFAAWLAAWGPTLILVGVVAAALGGGYVIYRRTKRRLKE